MGNKSGKLKKMTPEAEDAWKHSKFTVSEIQMFYSDFRKRYPDGYISLEEFKAMYREICLDASDADEFASYVFRLYDLDQNGKLNFKEFIVGLSISSYQNPKDRAAWIFNLYDLDADGYITIDEMKQVLRSIFKIHPNPTLNLALKLPLEIDDLTPEKIADKVFEKYDADSDGQLTLGELQTSVESDPYLSKLFS